MTADDRDLLDELAEIPVARTDDPDTSRASARQLGPRRASTARLLLYVFSLGHFTADEADDALDGVGGYKAGTWKRISDLKALGLIRDTGDRRPGRVGRQQIVYAITAAGREELVRVPPKIEGGS
jgi:hypothetical protein